jgi:hypothetical protein
MAHMKLTLPTDSAARKEFPVFSGFIKYFPAAIAGAARHSRRGNDKHNPGQELHHARGKSIDHSDCIPRHAIDIADMEAAIARDAGDAKDDAVKALLEEADALVWRAAAWSQELYEKYGNAPLAPAARLPEEKATTDVLKNGDLVRVVKKCHLYGRTGKLILINPCASSRGFDLLSVELKSDPAYENVNCIYIFYREELSYAGRG